MKGIFITIYGINNIGKSTHAKLLVERLQNEGHKAFYLKYPVYDIEPSGPFINNVLRDPGGQKISEEELQMWFAINRHQYEPELIRLLNEGFIVIAEDYKGTGIAWGTAKGVDQNWLESLNSKVLNEDLAIMIEGRRDERAMEKHHVHERNYELIEKSAIVHNDLAVKYGWKKVPLQAEIQDTHKLLWEVLSEFLWDHEVECW